MNDLFDLYEINTYTIAEKLADKSRRLAAKAVRDGNNAPMFVWLDVYRLNDALLNWERIIRPLEVRAVLQGGIYAPAKELAYELYDETIISLARYHVEATVGLAEDLIYVFRETPKLAEIFRIVVNKKKELDTEARKATWEWIRDGLIALLIILGLLMLSGLVDKLTESNHDNSYSPPEQLPSNDVQLDIEELEIQREEYERKIEELEAKGNFHAETEGEDSEN